MAQLRLTFCAMWILQLLLAALLLGQHWLGILHPSGEALVVLLVLTLGLLAWCVVRASQLLRQPQVRRRVLCFLIVTLAPVVLLVSCFFYAQQQWAMRQVPSGIRGQIAIMCGASLMELQVSYLYPKRAESNDLVMFYDDLTTPAADLAAMDQHVSQLFEFLEKKPRDKIHWVRGSLLGQRNVALLGLALSSEESPAWEQQGAVDRHELAHAVLNQFRSPCADPPMVLHEGWAEAKCGVDTTTLARWAIAARRENQDIKIAELFNSTNVTSQKPVGTSWRLPTLNFVE